MARKQTNTVEYFPHIAKQGKTRYILEKYFGNDGFAVLFKTFEILCQEENHYYDCNGSSAWQYYLAYTGVEEKTGSEIIDLLADMGTIDSALWKQARVIWCQNLVNNLKDVYQRRGRALPTKPDINLFINYHHQISISADISEPEIKPGTETDNSNPQSRVEETKVNKIKFNTSSRESDIALSPENNLSSKVNISLENTVATKETKKNSGRRQAADPRIGVIIGQIRAWYKEKGKNGFNPIPNDKAEGCHIKTLLARGFSPEDIFQCWKDKTEQRGGYCSMAFVNQDIEVWLNNGKSMKGNGHKKEPIPSHTAGELAQSWSAQQ